MLGERLQYLRLEKGMTQNNVDPMSRTINKKVLKFE